MRNPRAKPDDSDKVELQAPGDFDVEQVIKDIADHIRTKFAGDKGGGRQFSSFFSYPLADSSLFQRTASN
jgi:hypothetical protein